MRPQGRPLEDGILDFKGMPVIDCPRLLSWLTEGMQKLISSGQRLQKQLPL